MPWERPTNRLWQCPCGATSPWWTGCERFVLCSACDTRKCQADRAALRTESENSDATEIPSGYVLVGRLFKIRQTEKAVLITLRGGLHWLPKSAIAKHPQGVLVKDWLFQKIVRQQTAGYEGGSENV
jgi:hypothetical protein